VATSMLHTLALKSDTVDSRSLWSLPPCRLRHGQAPSVAGEQGPTAVGRVGGWVGGRNHLLSCLRASLIMRCAGMPAGSCPRAGSGQICFDVQARGQPPPPMSRPTAAPEAGVSRAQQVPEQRVAAVLAGYKDQQLALLIPAEREGRGRGKGRGRGEQGQTKPGCRGHDLGTVECWAAALASLHDPVEWKTQMQHPATGMHPPTHPQWSAPSCPSSAQHNLLYGAALHCPAPPGTHRSPRTSSRRRNRSSSGRISTY